MVKTRKVRPTEILKQTIGLLKEKEDDKDIEYLAHI
jgi:hypothetical protein